VAARMTFFIDVLLCPIGRREPRRGSGDYRSLRDA
jgi:hypothetical protein